jgi:hypothetical protein
MLTMYKKKPKNRLSKLLQNGNIAWINNKFSLHPITLFRTQIVFAGALGSDLVGFCSQALLRATLYVS